MIPAKSPLVSRVYSLCVLALMANLFFFAPTMLGGCVTPVVPKTVGQQIAAARASLAGLYNTATSLSQVNRISTDQIKRILEKGRTVESALNTAEVALNLNKNEPAAIEALRVAQQLLRELDSNVKAAQGGAL